MPDSANITQEGIEVGLNTTTFKTVVTHEGVEIGYQAFTPPLPVGVTQEGIEVGLLNTYFSTGMGQMGIEIGYVDFSLYSRKMGPRLQLTGG